MQMHNDISVASPSDSSKQVVHSSQSDQAELVLPIPELCHLKEAVEGIHA